MRRSLILAASLAALSSSAFAADLGYTPPPSAYDAQPMAQTGGFYGSFHGGMNWFTDTTADFVGGPGTFSTNNGYRIGGALGYDFNQNFGLEAEISHAHANVSGLDISGSPAPVSGSAGVTTVMGNAILGTQFGAWRPYVGAGVGAARVGLNVDTGGGTGANDSDWTWAAQAFAGVDYNFSQNMSLGARYRYQYIGGSHYSDFDGDPVSIDHVSSHSLEAVLKMRFGG